MLPNEIVLEILSHLNFDVLALVRCLAVSKTFRSLIHETSELMYLIELAKAEKVDLPTGNTAAENLEKLRACRERLNTMDSVAKYDMI
ncbi:hypothetical protein SISSUDRAFT_1066556 [Sistotremastrum suecicum HHB10207 ss-3]|uniref:F-box domain-containing protein n=1 Tax=Sistotremastrum suecicum HHB10207 ss-3 TaxID=1314776 RepID=A0A165Y622_9AGAM|nr:hypothetical protein SISSUDRAFT_1066556 [Sistotremastrum suecicum HHB10207 ss-3]